MKTVVEIGNEMIGVTNPREMTRDEMDTFIILEMNHKTLDATAMPAVPEGFKIADARLKAVNLEASNTVLFMISTLCDCPGTVVLYCAAIAAIAKKYGTRKVTWQQFVEAFGLGFPSEKDLRRFWQGQKVASAGPGLPDNALDYVEAWT